LINVMQSLSPQSHGEHRGSQKAFMVYLHSSDFTHVQLLAWF
jgi:hypothetical protein